MKMYLEVLVAGMLAAACSSNNNPPAASADSVEQASSTPSTGPGFAPVGNDGTASAAAAHDVMVTGDSAVPHAMHSSAGA